MPVLGITGGIASGKTSFTHALQHWLQTEAFDTDVCAHELVASDPEVQKQIRAAFGAEVFANEQEIDRAKLRNIVFADNEKRRLLENILHPRIREKWGRLARDFESRSDWYCVNIPLLYETGAESYFAAIVVVACSVATQIQRLTATRGLPEKLARSIIAAQMPLADKIARSAHVVWNDGSQSMLERQSELFAKCLTVRYG